MTYPTSLSTHSPSVPMADTDSRCALIATAGLSDLQQSLGSKLQGMRAAQHLWSEQSVNARLRAVGRIAEQLANQGLELAQSVVRPAASPGEILASEVLPLAEACRFVARRGGDVLASRRLPARDRAWWMGSVRVMETRCPYGLVLVIGPSNYPLLLPGVQCIQALAAGNGVLLKPAAGGTAAMQRLVSLCIAAGVPKELMVVLPESPLAAEMVIRHGIDKVLFTGSRRVGKLVAAQLAQDVIPGVFELSGNDAVLVCDDADLDRVATTVAYALGLNGGQSCIAPRKILATAQTMDALIPRLCAQVRLQAARSVPPTALVAARQAAEAALAAGASVICGGLEHWESAERVSPLILADVRADMPVAQEDLFAPVLSLITVADLPQAVAIINGTPLALGASVFGCSATALAMAEQLNAGCVTINDCLVPTADPRVSFGGWRASGYGVTRGLEGLRELTQLKITCERRGRWLPHLGTQANQLESLMRGLLWLRHGRTVQQRWRGIQQLTKSIVKGK